MANISNPGYDAFQVGNALADLLGQWIPDRFDAVGIGHGLSQLGPVGVVGALPQVAKWLNQPFENQMQQEMLAQKERENQDRMSIFSKNLDAMMNQRQAKQGQPGEMDPRAFAAMLNAMSRRDVANINAGSRKEVADILSGSRTDVQQMKNDLGEQLGTRKGSSISDAYLKAREQVSRALGLGQLGRKLKPEELPLFNQMVWGVLEPMNYPEEDKALYRELLLGKGASQGTPSPLNQQNRIPTRRKLFGGSEQQPY